MNPAHIASFAAIALMALPGAGEAQRYGGMPAPAVRQEAPREPERRQHHYRRHHPAPARYLILNDGTIIADLGWGYEQVVRSCQLSGGQQQTWVSNPAATAAPTAGGLQQAPGWQPAPGHQPAPGQQHASSQQWTPPRYEPPRHPSASHVSPVVTSRAAPCWVRDGHGNIVIVNR
jgi:hypothetical protein